jgi:hypothetical protein
LNNSNSDITIKAEGKHNSVFFEGLLEDSLFSENHKDINQILKTLKDQVGEEIINLSLTYSNQEGLNKQHVHFFYSDFQVDSDEFTNLLNSGLDI